MTALVAEKSRQVGLTFAERVARAVELLDAQLLLPKGAITAYATARLLRQDTVSAVLSFYLGQDWRRPSSGWDVDHCRAWGEALKARFEAAEDRIRAKAGRP